MTQAKAKGPGIKETVGIFAEAELLKRASDALRDAGFSCDELGLLASERTVKQGLADWYICDEDEADADSKPAMAFVERKSVGTSARSMSGSLFFIGGGGALGGIVASSAVLGGALLAAVGGALAVGAIGALVGKIISQNEAEYLQEQVDNGHLLLFVRVADAERERLARELLAANDAVDVRSIELSPNREDVRKAG